jgi:hypothetical protein
MLGIVDYVNGLQDGQVEDNAEFTTACAFAAEIAAFDPTYLRDADESLRLRNLVRQIKGDLGYGQAVAGEPPVGFEPPPDGAHVMERLSLFGRFFRALGGIFMCAGIDAIDPVHLPPELLAQEQARRAAAAAARGGGAARDVVAFALPQCPPNHSPMQVIALRAGDQLECAVCGLNASELHGLRILTLYRFIHPNENNTQQQHDDRSLYCKACVYRHIKALNDGGSVQCRSCGGRIHPCELSPILPDCTGRQGQPDDPNGRHNCNFTPQLLAEIGEHWKLVERYSGIFARAGPAAPVRRGGGRRKTKYRKHTARRHRKNKLNRGISHKKRNRTVNKKR